VTGVSALFLHQVNTPESPGLRDFGQRTGLKLFGHQEDEIGIDWAGSDYFGNAAE